MSAGTTPQVGDKVKYQGPTFEGPAEGLFLGLHYSLADCGRVDFRTHTLIVRLAELTVTERATYEPVGPPAPVFDPKPGTLWRTDEGLLATETDGPNGRVFLSEVFGTGCYDVGQVTNPRPVVPVDAEKLAEVENRTIAVSLGKLVRELRPRTDQP